MGLTGTSGRVGYWNETWLNWTVLSNFAGTSPSSEDESISGTRSQIWKMTMEAPAAEERFSRFGMACPSANAPIRTLKNTCTHTLCLKMTDDIPPRVSV
jgi:hypothetical protein